MINPNKALRTWLLGTSAITDLVGIDNVCYPDLPEGFDATKGDKAIVFSGRGGAPHTEMPLLNPSYQFRAWARRPSEARAIYGALYDTIHAKNNIVLGNDGVIKSSYIEVEGQDVTDEVTGWATVICFARFVMRAYAADPAPGAAIPVVAYGLSGFRRYTPVESPDGILLSFTFPGLPTDDSKILVALDGLVDCGPGGYTRAGDVLTFPTAPHDVCVFY